MAAESLGNAVLDLTTDNSKLDSGLSNAESTTRSRMGKIGGLIGGAAKAGAIATAAAGAAAIAAAFKTAAYGDEVAKTATKLGVNSEALQEMRFWADHNGISAQSLDRSVGRLNQRVGLAIEGNKKYSEGFQDLGVSITDAEGNARSTNDVMADTIAALSQIEDPALRSAKASEVFGTKMARDLMPALQDGSLSLEDAATQARELGIVMSDENAAAAEEFTDSWTDIKESVGGFIRDAAIPVMKVLNDKVFPVIQDGIGWLRDLFEVFQEGDGIVDGFKNVLGKLGGEGEGLFSGILDAAKGVFSSLVDWLASGGLQSILTWLLESRMRLFSAAMEMFPAILDAAIQFIPQLLDFLANQAIPGILEQITTAVPQLLDAAVELFSQLVEAIVQVLPDLLGTLLGEVLPDVLQTILGMIPQLLMAAVEAFTTLIDAVVDILPDLLSTLLGTVLPNVLTTIIEMVPKLLTAGITAFIALVEAVLEVLPQLLRILLTEVLPSLVDTIANMAPELILAAVEAFGALLEAVAEILPDLIAMIVTELVPMVIEAVMTLVPKLFEAGKNIILGLIDGIKSMIGAVGDAIGSVVGTVTDWLPFSPAKKGPLRDRPPDLAGMKIGEMLAQGLDDSVNVVAAAMTHLVDFGGLQGPDDMSRSGPLVGQVTMSGLPERLADELSAELGYRIAIA